jgi:hypothetical protein
MANSRTSGGCSASRQYRTFDPCRTSGRRCIFAEQPTVDANLDWQKSCKYVAVVQRRSLSYNAAVRAFPVESKTVLKKIVIVVVAWAVSVLVYVEFFKGR